ncbi:homocysteine S-methyltransferase family protein [Streptomyces hilarionis]|uniref:homocysteine S-methyltransferase family protein n=1 Tax=Streptomyces hilarionis TaxID=2839954 RepID=UPI00279609AD|nr:homocysteine S-methyltransferase family protein [Streptomyces hilarionis]
MRPSRRHGRRPGPEHRAPRRRLSERRRHLGPESRRRLGAQDEITDLVPSWLQAGAALIGGCCRVGPAEIKALADSVGAAPADR